MEQNGPDSVDLIRVLAGRKDPEMFTWFLDEIAAVVVGMNAVEHVKSLKLPCDWLTPSLEAFSLLCLENYFERVQSEVRKDKEKRPQKWTKDSRGSRKNQGWGREAIQRYNKLIESVRRDRATLKKVDESYFTKKQEERIKLENERLLKRQETIDGREKELLVAEDDFSSDSDCE